MKNVPPSVRAALKNRGREDILQQEGDYQTFKAEIDQIIHGSDNSPLQMGQPDFEVDLETPEEKKANEAIEGYGEKYKLDVNNMDDARPNETKLLNKLDEYASDEDYKQQALNAIQWNGNWAVADRVKKDELLGSSDDYDYSSKTDEEISNDYYAAVEDGLVNPKDAFETMIGDMPDDSVGDYMHEYELDDDDYEEDLGINDKQADLHYATKLQPKEAVQYLQKQGWSPKEIANAFPNTTLSDEYKGYNTAVWTDDAGNIKGKELIKEGFQYKDHPLTKQGYHFGISAEPQPNEDIVPWDKPDLQKAPTDEEINSAVSKMRADAGQIQPQEQTKNDSVIPMKSKDFLNWHEGEYGKVDNDTLNKVYRIFEENGSTNDEDVDFSYNKLPESKKAEVTKLINNSRLLDYYAEEELDKMSEQEKDIILDFLSRFNGR